MSEELQPVDESVLTSLIDLRRERDALRQRLARMQEAAADLSEKVLARVRSDYESRIAALDAKAAPLKDAARGTYGGLLPQLDRARAECESLRLDREEIVLRHELGEFDVAEYRDREARSDESLSAAEERVETLSGVVERFRGAFDSAEELAPATTSQVGLPESSAPTPAAGSPADAAAVVAAPPEDDGTLMLPPEPPSAPAPPPLPELPLEPPVWTPSLAWSNASPAGASEEPWRAAASPFDDLQPPPAPSASSPSSVVHEVAPAAPTGDPAVPPANPPAPPARPRLEALDGDLEPQPHYLEPLTFIGRTPENQIRIYKPAVSRRHAQITETDAGWLLRDLSSENGTYVNGQRVTERLLADGDRVQFGTSRFVLRLAT
ncbi:MAG: FHA domain-containing protein [Thermoanaerobaculia bacterium]|nr:FHA domain-containing protein [Thermoanaerobaculia bacterium]